MHCGASKLDVGSSNLLARFLNFRPKGDLRQSTRLFFPFCMVVVTKRSQNLDTRNY